MQIPTTHVKELREQSGAGVMDCRNALLETKGDMQKALELLQQQGFSRAQKKLHRSATEGLIEAYIHTGGRIGAMVEVNCETDFVARTDEFKELAHNLAMQVAACPPQCISEDEIPEGNWQALYLYLSGTNNAGQTVGHADFDFEVKINGKVIYDFTGEWLLEMNKQLFGVPSIASVAAGAFTLTGIIPFFLG